MAQACRRIEQTTIEMVNEARSQIANETKEAALLLNIGKKLELDLKEVASLAAIDNSLAEPVGFGVQVAVLRQHLSQHQEKLAALEAKSLSRVEKELTTQARTIAEHVDQVGTLLEGINDASPASGSTLKQILSAVGKVSSATEQLKGSSLKLLEAATDAPLIRQSRITAENALISPLGARFAAASMQLSLALESGVLGFHVDRILEASSVLLSSLLETKQ